MQDLRIRSTRGQNNSETFSKAILRIASFMFDP